MFRMMLKSKIHRATITEANVNYQGSITIDENLMDAADIIENEKVHVVNLTNGVRLETYAIPGPRNSGTVKMNGAAAKLMHEGEKVIILSYVMLENEEALTHRPKIVLLDRNNSIMSNDKIAADII